jgi:hypothetical protein
MVLQSGSLCCGDYSYNTMRRSSRFVLWSESEKRNPAEVVSFQDSEKVDPAIPHNGYAVKPFLIRHRRSGIDPSVSSLRTGCAQTSFQGSSQFHRPSGRFISLPDPAVDRLHPCEPVPNSTALFIKALFILITSACPDGHGMGFDFRENG